MTPTQAALLRDLISADRYYRSRLAAGVPVSSEDRGVEVGRTVGADPRTAQTLVNAGLAEMLYTGRNRSNWLFLGSYQPLDDVDGKVPPPDEDFRSVC